jgi:tripartite-type tricarboxylate transporter receptor subunit TctC
MTKAIIVLLQALFATAASAQTFPEKPVQIIIPFDAGGNTDLMARALQEEMGKALGQPVVPINKAGAGGTLGASELARSKPDGYTVGMVPNGPLTLQPNIRPLPYGPDSFDYICQTYSVPLFMMVKNDSPFKSVADVVHFAKSNPNGLMYGTSGPGGMLHVSMEAFLRAAGITATHVPFRGTGELTQALLGGTVMLFNETPGIAAANNLRILGAFLPERDPSKPDVPTMKEQGFDLAIPVWGGLVGPKGLGEAALGKLRQACQQAATSEGYKNTAAKLNTPPFYRSGAEFEAFVKQQFQTVGDVIRAAGLQAK